MTTDGSTKTPDRRRSASSAALTSAPAERNKQPILEVLERVLPSAGVVLEIASGTGQHVAHFARALPNLTFQPSEADASMHASIAAHSAGVPHGNVRAPVALDVLATSWPIDGVDAIICINMIHIAPWAATAALMAGAARRLNAGGVLALYGPFKMQGRHTAPSNAAFDDSLRSQNAAWGVRDLESVTAVAEQHGFAHDESVSMPANNFVVIYRRR